MMHLKQSAKMGNTSAACEFARRVILADDEYSISINQAFEVLDPFLKQEDPEIMGLCGLIMIYIGDPDKDGTYVKARAYLKKAVESEPHLSCSFFRMYAGMLYYGAGGETNKREAFKWFTYALTLSDENDPDDLDEYISEINDSFFAIDHPTNEEIVSFFKTCLQHNRMDLFHMDDFHSIVYDHWKQLQSENAELRLIPNGFEPKILKMEYEKRIEKIFNK